MAVDACGRAIRRSVPAIIATVAITGLGSGLWLGYRFVTTSERFAIDHIEVRGTERLTADQVRASLPVKLGENLILADLGDVTSALRAEPWIETADVRRQLPSTVIVEIREHRPAVVVALPTATGDELYLADASGRPFKRATPADRSDLPLVTGLERTAFRSDPEGTARRVVGALDVYAQWHATDRLPIREIRFDPQGGVSLIAREPVFAIELSISWQAGRDDIAVRLRTFDAVWNELSTDERTRVRTIHLGNRPDHVTVAFKGN